jgi:ElaB/YqjD/DUF883 family membrane-anchored ribosome-binding protein
MTTSVADKQGSFFNTISNKAQQFGSSIKSGASYVAKKIKAFASTIFQGIKKGFNFVVVNGKELAKKATVLAKAHPWVAAGIGLGVVAIAAFAVYTIKGKKSAPAA